MRYIKIIAFTLISLGVYQSAFSCSVSYSEPKPLDSVNRFKQSSEVFVAKVVNITFEAPEDDGLKLKFLNVQYQNDSIDQKVIDLQNKLELLKISLTPDEEIKRLKKQVEDYGYSFSDWSIKKDLNALGEEIDSIFNLNYYKDSTEIIKLRKQREELRTKYVAEIGKLATLKSRIESIKIDTRFKTQDIEALQADIDFFINQKKNIKAYAKSFTVEMEVLKNYKGNTQQGGIVKYKGNHDSWPCGYSFNNFLNSLTKKQVIALYDGFTGRYDDWQVFGQVTDDTVSKINWKKIMSEIEEGSYRDLIDPYNGNGFSRLEGQKTHAVDLRKSMSVRTGRSSSSIRLGIAPDNLTLEPQNQRSTKSCERPERTEFDSINKYKSAESVFTAKVIKKTVEDTDDNQRKTDFLIINKTIIERVESLQANLGKLKKADTFDKLIEELDLKNKTLDDVQNPKEMRKELRNIDFEINELYNANKHENTARTAQLRDERKILRSDYISRVKEQAQSKFKLVAVNIFKRFNSKDSRGYEENITYLQGRVKSFKDYYAGNITIEMEVIKSYKGEVKEGDKRVFVSTKRESNTCNNDFVNRYIYRAKKGEVVTLYSSDKKLISHWATEYISRYWNGSEYTKTNYGQDRMKKIKAGTFRDHIYKPKAEK